MILEKKPVTMIDVKEIVKNLDEKQELKVYLKRFSKITKDKSEKLREEIQGLNNLKVKEEDIVKLIDFLPKDKEDVNKIFSDTNLTEEETNAILEIVKKY